MSRATLLTLLVALFLISSGCSPSDGEDLVIYSGRSRALVEPLIERFEEQSGLNVGVRFGDTAQLAVALIEEGNQSSADVFWAQDGGALGALEQENLFAELPTELLDSVVPLYRGDSGTWIATSGRARVLAYSADRIDEADLPESIFDLTDPEYEGRIGWAPTNGSFQAHVTAMRALVGDDSTRAWLEALNDNSPKSYPRNAAIVQAIADGEIDFGLPNHYYLLRFLDDDPNFPVEQTFFADGDAGNLINVAGVGILSSSYNRDAAIQFVEFLLSDETQSYFGTVTKEYPVIDGVEADDALPERTRLDELRPSVEFTELGDLQTTLQMMREVGIL